jgi:hypothetical protein
MFLWVNSNKNPRGGSWGEWLYEPIIEKKIFSRESRLEAYLKTSDGDKRKSLNANIDKKIGEGYLNDLAYEQITEGEIFGRESELVMALTERCAQYRWRVPSYFPCCPEEIGANSLEAYFQNLKVGAVFSYNDSYPKSMILEFVKIKNNLSILVMCEKEGLKPWSIAEIKFENDYFVHSNLGSYFDKDGANKAFCIEQGLEWTGGDTFDDFC